MDNAAPSKKTRRKKVGSPPAIPKLFKRGPKDIYYFRVPMSGKDTWVSTRTSDYDDAIKAALSFVDARRDAEKARRKEKSIHKLATKISKTVVEDLSGGKIHLTPLADAYKKWICLTPGYTDLAKISKKYSGTVFTKFSDWCKEKGVKHIEEIDKETALNYSTHLWESGISGKTYNENIRILSRIMSTLDAAMSLPDRDPFDKDRIDRKGKSELETVGHNALEPAAMKAVLDEAAKEGKDWRDLFVIGSQSGMRLKDAALLEWAQIEDDFIQITPHKTKRKGNTARIPISKNVRAILVERIPWKESSVHVIPAIAEKYKANPESIAVKAKKFFERALGKDNTVTETGKHRKNRTCIYSFHSFRTTFMSLLARQDVSIRDAMRIMGWESVEMIRVYERELERAKGDADKRAIKMINRIDEFDTELPDSDKLRKLVPTQPALTSLVDRYSNITIGKIYDISEAAVRKWLKKFGIERTKRIESPRITEEKVALLRNDILSVETSETL